MKQSAEDPRPGRGSEIRRSPGRRCSPLLRVLLTAVVATALLAWSGCRRETKRDAYTVGVIATLSGEGAPNGVDMTDAVKLAVRQVRADGGLRVGRDLFDVRVIAEDDGNTPGGAMSAARRLIFQVGVDALIGPQLSSHAIPVGGLAEAEGIPMICPMSTHPDTTSGRRYVFRVPFLDTFQGYVLARFARNTCNASRAAVLYDVAGEYSRTLAEVFMASFRELGGEISDQETYTTDQSADFADELGRIAASEPDVLVLPNFDADVWRQGIQARRQGIEAVLLGGDGWNASRYAELEPFSGSFLVSHWDPGLETAQTRHFVRAFDEAYDRMPGDVAATSYDAGRLLFAAVREAGSVEPAEVRTALYAMGPVECVTGTIDYTDSGDPVKSAVVLRIGDGDVEVYGRVDPRETIPSTVSPAEEDDGDGGGR